MAGVEKEKTKVDGVEAGVDGVSVEAEVMGWVMEAEVDGHFDEEIARQFCWPTIKTNVGQLRRWNFGDHEPTFGDHEQFFGENWVISEAEIE
ncbi:hypothetical protein Nepgr_032667 [Nepenthes gracilis]|uniref:Uncharacterized protein n=1 Tax=Nepenthes gracilis TaxID=150966 RepID=A0AAD3Y820_NEPGR|nr:hypothetical protein Nepgr_032667 [Nepenthes gracilis]